MSQSLDNSNNNNNNDELLSQFMAFTGTSDADKATSYLEMSGNDVETAVGLYMEHEMGNATGGTSSTMGGVAAASNAGYVDLGNEDFDDMLDERERRTVGGNSSRNGRRTNPRSNRTHTERDEDGIRAPDQTRTMRLMDDDSVRGGIASMLPPNIASMVMGHNPSYDLMTAMMDEQDLMMMQQQQAAATVSSSAFASTAATVTSLNARALLDAAIARQDQHTQPSSARQRLQQRLQQDEKDSYDNDDHDDDDDIEYDDDDDDDNDENNVRGGRNRAIVEPPRLSDMFAAPHHLIHRAGGFQGARTMAKDTKRWLLVNLQRDAEFACHALNRDVWRDELVENLIREGFIFWQQMDTTPEGRTFSERYQVHDYPHISIIDPRTGRLMWRKEGWTQQNALTADSFAEVVMDFCSRNSFDRPPQAPRPPNAAAATTTSSSSSSTPAKRMHEMSEDELLQEAMKASMSDVAGGTTTTFDSTELVCLDDDLDDSDVQIVEDTKPQAVVTQEEETKTISLSEELQSYVLSDEPTTSTDSSRIQFRLVDGKRITRRFASSDPVRAVYAFVAQTTEEARTTGREFVLMAGFPPNDLLNDIDNSIADVKLNGETITVRWK